MILSHLFPVRVVQDEIVLGDDLRCVLLDDIKHRTIECGDHRSAVGDAWRSRLNLHQPTNHDSIMLLMEKVKKFTERAIHALHVNARYEITECWLNVLRAGAYNAPHDHYPNHWSGVLWIDVEDHGEKDSPAGNFEFHCPYPARAMGCDTGALFVQPMNGVAILFPAGLKHMVHPVARGERISLAWNIIVEPEKKT